MMMNRYILFHGDYYYPLGGMEDFKKSSNVLEELLPFLSEMKIYEWAHIYDCNEKKIILQSIDIINGCDYQYKWVSK